MGYPTDNREKISKALSDNLRAGLKRVNENLQNRVYELNKSIAGLNAKYNPVRNQLTQSYRSTARANEEHIANTGNHTASGYAISKRMSHTDAYNRGLNDINIAQAKEQADLNAQIRKTRAEANDKIAALRAENAEKKLKYQLDEAKRLDDMGLEYAKHNETKRMNDAQISRIAVQNERDEDGNRRAEEEHKIYMRFYPERLESENESIKAKTKNTEADTEAKYASIRLTDARTETEKVNKLGKEKDIEYTEAQIEKLKSSPVKVTGGAGRGKTKSEILSKMTPKDLAENINEQTGTLRYSHTGAPYYEVNAEKAAILLLEWRKKFNLSPQVVNDTAIHLGIQSYI